MSLADSKTRQRVGFTLLALFAVLLILAAIRLIPYVDLVSARHSAVEAGLPQSLAEFYANDTAPRTENRLHKYDEIQEGPQFGPKYLEVVMYGTHAPPVTPGNTELVLTQDQADLLFAGSNYFADYRFEAWTVRGQPIFRFDPHPPHSIHELDGPIELHTFLADDASRVTVISATWQLYSNAPDLASKFICDAWVPILDPPDDPYFMSILSRHYDRAGILRVMEYIANHPATTAADLTIMIDAISDPAADVDLSAAIAGEHATFAEVFRAGSFKNSNPLYNYAPPTPSQLVTGSYQRDQAMLIDALATLYQAAETQPINEFADRMEAIVDEAEASGLPISSDVLPAFLRFFRHTQWYQAQRNAALVALTYKRNLLVATSALVRGRTPIPIETLASLALPKPIDPYDGEPMRVVLRDNHIIVYSVGPDGIDNDALPEPGRSGNSTPGTDITFTVRLD